jgi:hypothetical protein
VLTVPELAQYHPPERLSIREAIPSSNTVNVYVSREHALQMKPLPKEPPDQLFLRQSCILETGIMQSF